MEDFGIQPKSTVALKMVINPAGMALDIKIFHGFQLELNTGLDFNCLFNWNCSLLPFFHRGDVVFKWNSRIMVITQASHKCHHPN